MGVYIVAIDMGQAPLTPWQSNFGQEICKDRLYVQCNQLYSWIVSLLPCTCGLMLIVLLMNEKEKYCTKSGLDCVVCLRPALVFSNS